MKKLTFENMVKGWFIGNFNPTAFKTNACEVAYKKYKSGDYDSKHYHKIATEITFIVSGKVLMNEIEYKKDDIIIIEPGDITDFRVLEDTETIVVKVPGANDDKYLV
jgi:quercetin dioxygenase-like cupin family protein